MKILLYIKAFISGMMMKPDKPEDFIKGCAKIPKASGSGFFPVFESANLERIQPKRKKTADYIISAVNSDGMNILTPYGAKELPKRKYKKRKK